MDLQRLKDLLDWMARSPVDEIELREGDFEVHLKKSPGGQVASVPPIPAPLERGHDVVAASYGVVHLSPSPGAPPFVVLGQSVANGHSLCTIEAMKVFSPIEADRAGTIAAILVDDGAEVSAGQTLFRIE